MSDEEIHQLLPPTRQLVRSQPQVVIQQAANEVEEEPVYDFSQDAMDTLNQGWTRRDGERNVSSLYGNVGLKITEDLEGVTFEGMIILVRPLQDWNAE